MPQRAGIGDRRYLRLSVAGGALLVALLAVIFARPKDPLAELAAAIEREPRRPSLARFSSPFAYAPPPIVARGRKVESTPRAEAVIHGILARQDQHSASGEHALALATFFTGSATRSAAMLAELAPRANDADVWNDLAAVRLAESESQGSETNALDALAAANRARGLDPNHAAAAFNRAVALERLGLLQESLAAWNEALRLDRDSRWRDEERAAAAAIASELRLGEPAVDLMKAVSAANAGDEAAIREAVRGNPRAARRGGEGPLLAAWATSVLQSNEVEAEKRLTTIRRVAQALRDTTGESLLFDAVRTIDATKDRRTLALASAAYAAGRMELNRQRMQEAEAKLREAEQLFARAGSPLALLARYSVGSALYAQARTADAAAILDEVAGRNVAARGYHGLAGQIGWERGLTFLVQGRFSEATSTFEAARAEFDRLGESEMVATMDEFLAEAADFAGDEERAWQTRRRALQALSRAGDSGRKITSLDAASTACLIRGDAERAMTLLDLAVDAAVSARDATRASDTLANRAIAAVRAGRRQQAEADVAQMQRWLRAIPDPATRASVQARGLFAEALLVRGEPAAASRLLTEALAAIRASGRSYFEAQILLERSSVERAGGDLEAAAADIAAALAALEVQRANVLDVERRALAFATANAVVDAGVSLALDRGLPAEAFALLERTRGRALLDGLQRLEGAAGVAAEPMSLEELSRALAPSAAIVEYALLPDRLVAFVVRRDGLQAVQTKIAATRARDVASRAAAEVARGEAARTDALGEAHTLFVAPLAQALPANGAVAFIPGAALANLPFAALYDSVTRTFLSESRPVVVAPSATVAVTCSRAARTRTAGPAVAIAADDFDRRALPDLAALPHVVEEARSIARMYRSGAVVEGTGADKRRVASAMSESSVIHFAGHATAAGSSAADAALIVAGDGMNGRLTAAEIAELDLRHTRLVYLSACGSGAAAHRGDGVENLATAFLVAGAPTVIGAPFDLDDRTAEEIAARFHERFSAGSDPASALSNAFAQSRSKQPPNLTMFGGLATLVE